MKRIVLAASILPLCACAEAPDSADQVRAPPVEVLGEPVNCVLVSRIRNTVVHDDSSPMIDSTGVHTFMARNPLNG